MNHIKNAVGQILLESYLFSNWWHLSVIICQLKKQTTWTHLQKTASGKTNRIIMREMLLETTKQAITRRGKMSCVSVCAVEWSREMPVANEKSSWNSHSASQVAYHIWKCGREQESKRSREGRCLGTLNLWGERTCCPPAKSRWCPLLFSCSVVSESL